MHKLTMESIKSLHNIVRKLMIIFKILTKSISRIRDLESCFIVGKYSW